MPLNCLLEFDLIYIFNFEETSLYTMYMFLMIFLFMFLLPLQLWTQMLKYWLSLPTWEDLVRLLVVVTGFVVHLHPLWMQLLRLFHCQATYYMILHHIGKKKTRVRWWAWLQCNKKVENYQRANWRCISCNNTNHGGHK